MIKIYVLSNDNKPISELFDFIYKTEGLKIVGVSDDLVKVALSIYSSCKPDIIIVNQQINEERMINLNDSLGLAFNVVFVDPLKTLSKEFFEKHRLNYMQKPFGYDKFLERVNLPKPKWSHSKPKFIQEFHKEDHFFIKCEKGKIIRININDIFYIEASQNYIIINQTGEKCIANFTLNGIEKVLSENVFIRVHRSFIININKIRSIESNRVILDKNIIIPIGQSYKAGILDVFNPRILILNKIMLFIAMILSLYRDFDFSFESILT